MQHMPTLVTETHLSPLGLNMGALNVNTAKGSTGSPMAINNMLAGDTKTLMVDTKTSIMADTEAMMVETKASMGETKGDTKGAEKENWLFQCKVCLAKFKKEKYLRDHKRNCQPNISKRPLQVINFGT